MPQTDLLCGGYQYCPCSLDARAKKAVEPNVPRNLILHSVAYHFKTDAEFSVPTIWAPAPLVDIGRTYF